VPQKLDAEAMPEGIRFRYVQVVHKKEQPLPEGNGAQHAFPPLPKTGLKGYPELVVVLLKWWYNV
jgi:hypothetical protein